MWVVFAISVSSLKISELQLLRGRGIRWRLIVDERAGAARVAVDATTSNARSDRECQEDGAAGIGRQGPPNEVARVHRLEVGLIVDEVC